MEKLTVESIEREIYDIAVLISHSKGLTRKFNEGRLATWRHVLSILIKQQEEETRKLKKNLEELYLALGVKRVVLDGTQRTPDEVVKQKIKEGSCK